MCLCACAVSCSVHSARTPNSHCTDVLCDIILHNTKHNITAEPYACTIAIHSTCEFVNAFCVRAIVFTAIKGFFSSWNVALFTATRTTVTARLYYAAYRIRFAFRCYCAQLVLFHSHIYRSVSVSDIFFSFLFFCSFCLSVKSYTFWYELWPENVDRKIIIKTHTTFVYSRIMGVCVCLSLSSEH